MIEAQSYFELNTTYKTLIVSQNLVIFFLTILVILTALISWLPLYNINLIFL